MENKQLIESVEKMQQGDISSLKVVYEKTSSQVYRLLYSYTKNEQLSLDLMQDTYITLSKKICNVKHPEAIAKFINTIAINKARNYYKKSKKELLLSENNTEMFNELMEEDLEFLPEEILESREKQKIIKDIIDGLPLEQKTAVYLYYYNELSVSEIANAMECSDGTIKSRLNYARRKIKSEVDTWEKKGIKLYSTSMPVLLLILRNQISDVRVPLESINSLLKSVVNMSEGIISVGTMVSVKGGSIISKTGLAVKKTLAIKVIVGITAASIISGIVLFSNKEQQIDDIIYCAYSSIGIENGISDISSRGDNTFSTTISDEYRYLGFQKKDNIQNGVDDVVIIDNESNKYNMTVTVTNEDMDVVNNTIEKNCDYFSYKELTDGSITDIEVSDNNIVKVINEKDMHDIKIEAIAAGRVCVKVKDNKGKKSEFTVNTECDQNGLCSIISIDNIKK